MTEERGARSVVVLGGAVWSTPVEVPRLSTDPTAVPADRGPGRIGGTGARKALTLAGLGLRTHLHAPVGDDEPGTRVRAALAGTGVELTAWVAPQGTEQHLELTDRRGERRSIVVDAPGVATVDAADLAGTVGGADLTFVSLRPYLHGVLPLLASGGGDLWVDLQDWDGSPSALHDPFVEHGTHVFVSDLELADPRRTADLLVSQGKQLVVVTHGHRGATAFFPDRDPHFVLPYDGGAVVDAHGAGDAFCAGTAYGRLQGWDWGRALRAGSVVAGASVTSPHATAPDLGPDWLAARL